MDGRKWLYAVSAFACLVSLSCVSAQRTLDDVLPPVASAGSAVPEAAVEAESAKPAAAAPAKPTIRPSDAWMAEWDSSLGATGRMVTYRAEFPVSCLAFAVGFTASSSVPSGDIHSFFLYAALLEDALRAKPGIGHVSVQLVRRSPDTYVLYVAADPARFQSVLAQIGILARGMVKTDGEVARKARAEYWKATGTPFPVSVKDTDKSSLLPESVSCDYAVFVVAARDVSDAASAYQALTGRFSPVQVSVPAVRPRFPASTQSLRPEGKRVFAPSGAGGGAYAVCEAIIEGVLGGFEPRDCWMQYPYDDPEPDGYPGRLVSE